MTENQKQDRHPKLPRDRHHESRDVDVNQNDSMAVMEIIKYFKTERYQLMCQLKECRQHFEALEASKRNIDAEITSVRHEINGHLDHIESKLRKHLDLIHKEASKECQIRIEDMEKRHSALYEYQRKLEHAIRYWAQRRDSDLIDIQTFYEKTIQNNIGTTKSFEYDFQVNEKIENLQKYLKSFGEVKVQCYVNAFDDSGIRESHIPSLCQNLEDCTGTVTHTFSVGDDQNTAIGGCVYLYNGLLMVGNRNNDTLQLFDPNGVLSREVPLPGKPWDVCLVNAHQVAVSLPCNKQHRMNYVSTIQIIDSVSMVAVKDITFHGRTYGLTYNEGKFIIACGNELQIINLKGEVIHKIRVPDGCVRQVCSTDKGMIFYSDWNHNLIQCLGKEGMEVFSYSHPLLRGPVGISVDFEDNIYVASFISNNIHQLTPDGQLNRILLDKEKLMREPRIINFQKYTNKFAVCDGCNVKLCEMIPAS